MPRNTKANAPTSQMHYGPSAECPERSFSEPTDLGPRPAGRLGPLALVSQGSEFLENQDLWKGPWESRRRCSQMP
jgi:hypothetical protein